MSTTAHAAPTTHAYTTTAEIARDLERSESTIRHWAAGERDDFPPVIRLPNRRLLVATSDLHAWYQDLAVDNAATGRDRVAAANAVRRLPLHPGAGPVGCMTKHPDQTDPSYLTLAEFAALVRQPYSTVSQWRRRGGRHFPAHIRLPNRNVLIHVDDADRWLKGRRT